MTGTDDSREHRGFVIHGRVQGVGFRWWTRGVASELGVEGWVRNLPNGSVEVQAMAGPEALDALEARLAEGPRFAQVERVERAPSAPIEALGDFLIEQ